MGPLKCERGNMQTIAIQEAEKQLSRLVRDVMHGDEVILTEGSRPVAKIVSLPDALDNPQRPRKAGSGRGLFRTTPDFDAPLEDFNEYME